MGRHATLQFSMGSETCHEMNFKSIMTTLTMSDIQFLKRVCLLVPEASLCVAPASDHQVLIPHPGPRGGETRGLDDSCDSLYDSLVAAYLDVLRERDPGLQAQQRHVKLGETGGVRADVEPVMDDNLSHPDIHMSGGTLVLQVTFL